MPTTQISSQPGRLGNPDSNLGTDPRTDPRLLAAMIPFGLEQNAARPPLGPEAPVEARIEFALAAEAGFEGLSGLLFAGLPEITNVERSTTTISGVDGNELTLYIHKPTDVSGPVPGVLHLHGGGMTILQATNPGYTRWRDELASAGLVVVGVEFRNGAGLQGSHPFPAGLNDATSALEWVNANKASLGINTVTVQGESGGANLSIATALKAKREGRMSLIDGVYVNVPFISGAYEWDTADSPAELPSLLENDGYFIGNALNSVLKSLYDPTGENIDNPLAWPLKATVEELKGLPPFAVSVNELDPCRDEGIAFFRKLGAAGVPTTGKMLLGVCHAGEVFFPAAFPDVYAGAIADIVAFARRS